ncbi:unnamed protein product [Kuraishia capsulata CBS 1993]|uniref:Uncharacterized protein n=1 Tax=Kuraishia capsulata CBS 1993 TaxID=1382522 RepID=W6MNW9_9ASCO|nr:uncharacterized protein KUCA_T00004351001 [Kuraishia capsulata CBS 1993]CDK28369.1 unnamed protein product [Kuraishia capsulata CBS 1993]
MSTSSTAEAAGTFPPDVEKNLYEKDEAARARQASTNSTFRHDENHIYINDTPIDKRDFMYAFGGTFTTGLSTRPRRTFGNPVPAGLAAFSCTTITLGLVQLQARHVSEATVLLGSCFFCSGLVEIIAGIWCLILENTWASTVFLMFGGFWMSYACVLTSGFGIGAAYATTEEYSQAIALFYTPWAIFSFLLWICTFKSTLSMCLLMFLIWFFVLLFTIAEYTGSVGTAKAGGVFCLLSGLCGLYNCLAGMADTSNSYFTLKPFYLPGAARPPKAEKKES